MSKELIKKAFDANAWTYVGNSYGQAVAPAMFDERVMEYQKKELVVTPLARQIDFRRNGSTLTVTVDAAPSAAALTVETDAAAISTITNRQVTFTPIEYTKAYESSYTEMEDGFLDFMSNATAKIGYAQAIAKDALCVSRLYAGATSTVFVNSKTVATDIASTDVLTTSSLVDARTKIGALFYRPYALIISRVQEGALLKTTNIYKANEFGTRAAIENGLIGNLYGFDIYVSDSISPTANVEYAIALGKTQMGEAPFAVAVASNPTVEMDKNIRFRKVEVVGSERYDVQVIHPGGVCKIGTYA